MAVLEGPIICQPTLHATHTRVFAQLVKIPLRRDKNHQNSFWCCKRLCVGMFESSLSRSQFQWKSGPVHHSLKSSSDGSTSMPENFDENDVEYVNASVIEAVEVKSGSDGFFIRMRSGRNLRCVHSSPQEGHLPDYAPHPAIVLKIEDGSDVLLPIIVLEMPSILLMAALRNVTIARPTIYQAVQDMIDKMGYEARLVRVTKRVHEAYFAQLYLSKIGDKKDIISFDLRPSDAINMAVRCKVPIQVNRTLAHNDGIRIVGQLKHAKKSSQSDGLLTTELDRPDGQPCIETKEFDFVRNMLIAAVEERYSDAAQWRDKLFKLRHKKRNW